MWHSLRTVSLARLVRHCASSASPVADLAVHYGKRDSERIHTIVMIRTLIWYMFTREERVRYTGKWLLGLYDGGYVSVYLQRGIPPV